jgi:hypothetical protein
LDTGCPEIIPAAFLNAIRTFINDLSNWNLHVDELHLMTFPFSEAAETQEIWQGTLYQLAFYAGTMTPSDVEQLLLQGLPSTTPFAFYQTFSMNEDAEILAGSHNVE